MDLTEFFILSNKSKLKLIYTIVRQLPAKKLFVININISFLSYFYPFFYYTQTT